MDNVVTAKATVVILFCSQLLLQKKKKKRKTKTRKLFIHIQELKG